MLAEKLRSATAALNPAAWNLADAAWVPIPKNFLQSSPASSTFFKSDGLAFYNANVNTDSVQEYSLSIAWDISTANYVRGFSVGAQGGSPSSVKFKTDGTKMYVLNRNTSLQYIIAEYNLATAWNISTASYVQTYNINSQDSSSNDFYFKSDGLKMYVIGSTNDRIYEYNLSTAWNISTASFLQSFSIATQTTNPIGIFFKSDGLKVYIGSNTGIFEYNLSTAWNISTASYLQNYNPSINGVTNIYNPYFKTDGLVLYCYAAGNNAYLQFQVASAWNVTTASYSPPSDYYSVIAQETSPRGAFFKPDGLKMYVIGSAGVDVNEYNLSTPWEISTANYVQNFSVSAQDTTPRGVFFKSDGTKMYFAGQSGDKVYEYNLSTPWNISTAIYFQNFSIASQQGTCTGLYFSPDGVKMYITGTTGVGVYEYTLSSAWDVSTASYVQRLDTTSQETIPTGIFFKPTGLKLYICGSQGQDVNEYNLLVAWDISTASYVQNFNVAAQTTTPYGLFFQPNGMLMFLTSSGTAQVYSYDFI